MKKFFTIFSLLSLLAVAGYSQTRYLDPVFENVKVTKGQIYGVNATILLITRVGQAVPERLLYDLYEPEDDTLTARPLILVFKTGNFLPIGISGGVTGTRSDSANVEICTRLAKMGYVVASVDYRLGWNPLAATQPERALQLIQAAYRSVQDVHTALRYFNLNASNLRLATDKVTLWGIGTGGYVSLASSTLDNFTDIVTTTNPAGKFLTDLDGNGTPDPMVIPFVNGDLLGTTVGIVPPGFPPFPAGDTLCYPNHVGAPESFQLCVNMGGALGDISWLDASDVPFISFHVPKDQNAPYKSGVLIVPTTGDPIVEVQGSYAVAEKANQLGLNDVFKGIDDPITDAAKAAAAVAGNEYQEGLYAFNLDVNGFGQVDGSPWTWWEPSTWDTIPNPFRPEFSLHQTAFFGDPIMSPTKGRTYIDTIIAYFAPRAVRALKLEGTSAVKTLTSQEAGLVIAPNPSTGSAQVRVNPNLIIKHAEVYSLNGGLLQRRTHVNTNEFLLNHNNAPAGIYLLKLHLKEGVINSKLVIR